jgi:uncharacterized protein YecA (UPF0149 family)
MKLFERFSSKKPPKTALTLGRNEPCWCGSGKKYKKCHYESDREKFSKWFAATCTTST